MVSQVEASLPGLDSLPARPPTPPRERQNDNDPKLVLDRHPLASRLTLQTPPSHSPGSARSTNNSSRRSRKKVEFTVQAEYREPPSGTGKENEHKQSTPMSALSSATLSKPLKSILKPTSSPSAPNPLDPSAGQGEAGNTTNLAAMLESTVKQLASNDRDAKVDAYTMLVRALKTSTNLPDRIALQSKMSLFMQFIQRDITSKGGNGAIDSSLVNHALTLLSTFLHFPAIASAVTSDFGVFIIDHCIRSFEDRVTPKDVIRHLMQVVVFQDFSSKVMTADRVGRLVTALHNIDNHIKGKSIVMSRIMIYRRLVKQTTLHMVSHSEWLQDLFTDMLSSLKEIRAAAIALGMEASFTVAKEKQLQKKVMEILQMTVDETRYVEFYSQKLTAMTKEKSDMAAVPQIWSVVILLLRCPIDRWEFFDEWLAILQRCFNRGDYQTQIEANYAWNRLVYALHLYESSFSKAIGTLCQPFTQLRRRGKQPDELRKVVIGGICNLYYYAFKPNSNSTQVDQYWDACVRTVIRTLAFPEADGKAAEKQQTSSPENISQAANILAGLFDSSSIRLWKEDRIAENTLARPNDLPALDPKWIRRNAARVFTVVDPILQKSFLDLADPDSSSSKLWKSLISAVAIAASKEVKVSVDTAAFLGHALSLLMRIWAAGLSEATRSPETQQSFLKATETFLAKMILSIGHLPFTEKLLSMNKPNTLTPVATPSHRSGKGNGPTRSPLCHLFSILSTLPPGITDGEDVSDLFNAVFGPFMLTRSPRAKKDLAQELVQIPPPDGSLNYGPWIFIAEILVTLGDHSQSSYSSIDSASLPPIGHEFRDVVKHLERGISFTPNLPWSQWLSLFHFVVEQATELSGEAGCSVAVIEPLAKAILESSPVEAGSISSNLLKCGVQLISSAKQPRDRQALDAAKRRLWGTAVAGGRSASFDPFDNLYRLVSRLLEASYTTVDSLDEGIVASLITETSVFLARSNHVLVFKSLVQLQQGLGPWIQDADERFGSRQRSTVGEAVKLLWDRICDLFADTTLEHFQLDAIEQLLCRAFTSKHRHIVNSAVLLWNRGFENASDVQYPKALIDVLLSLRPYVDIALPGLEYSTSSSHNMAPTFMDSQDDLDVTRLSDKSGKELGSSLNGLSSSRGETPRPIQKTLSGHGESENSPCRSRSRSAKSSKRNRTPKLRHEDSQVQFAEIGESSPSNRAMESQVLTDRQKEVRERQLENAALFSSLRSSPRKDKGRLIPNSHQSSPQKSNNIDSSMGEGSATPKATRSYEYASLTPTPRRGQPSMVYEDHEMTDDIPSSPPEPRRNLLPEMKSHSRNTNMLDDMPISSSPISGSPVKTSQRTESGQVASQEVAVSVVTESISSQQVAATPRDVLALSRQERNEKMSVVGLIAQRSDIATNTFPPGAQGTPKSENEVFVDALTSPVVNGLQGVGSKIAQGKSSRGDGDEIRDRSFEMSDGEERSLARLVIELDSRKCDPLPTYDPTSPEKFPTNETTMECITVVSESEPEKHRSVKSQSSQSSIHSNSVDTDDSQTSMRRSNKKRKRAADKKQNTVNKRRHYEKADTEHPNTIMDSQVAQDHQRSSKAAGSYEEQAAAGESPLAPMQGSPDLAYKPDAKSPMKSLDLDMDEDMDPDTAEANLQLIAEASQQSESGHEATFASRRGAKSIGVERQAAQGGEPMEEDTESGPQAADTAANHVVAPARQSVFGRIMASLRDGLEGLRSATLSREEVYKVEDMFMDIKKELYEAERRSRQ